jgi:Flp pilus assembly protein TadG
MRRNLPHDQSGLAAVEFALIFPIMLLLFLGSFTT